MTNFPEYQKELATWMGKLGAEIPEVMQGLGGLHAASFKPGALDLKTKELTALGIAIGVRCDGCITSHVDAAMKAGATKQEIAEVIGVAILMGGGPSVVYGIKALQAFTQFEEENNKS